MSKTTEIEIQGKKYPYFRSANSVKKFAEVIAKVNTKGEDIDDSQSMELMIHVADVLNKGMKDAICLKSFWYRIKHRPPSKKMLMRCMTLEDMMIHVNGASGVADPNL